VEDTRRQTGLRRHQCTTCPQSTGTPLSLTLTRLPTVNRVLVLRTSLPTENAVYLPPALRSCVVAFHEAMQAFTNVIAVSAERQFFVDIFFSVVKGRPCSITQRRVPELIPVLGSQPAGDAIINPAVGCH